MVNRTGLLETLLVRVQGAQSLNARSQPLATGRFSLWPRGARPVRPWVELAEESGLMSDVDIPRLLEEIPLLYKARAFADGFDSMPLMARLGEKLDDRERGLTRHYLDGLGFPHAEAALLSDWDEAADAAAALDRDPEGWEAEEMLRAGLIDQANERLESEAIQAILTYVTMRAGEVAQDAVTYSSAFSEIDDEALQNAAVGMLVRAAEGGALVILAEAEDEEPPHPFLTRWRLFARGRWPVGIAGSTYNIL